MLCAAACGSTWGVADLRRRGLLVRMVECTEHILCWECTQQLVRWSVRKGVGYFYCPLCRCEVREVVRDGGGRSSVQFSVPELASRAAAADRAAAKGRRREKREQEQRQEQAEQEARKQQIEAQLNTELGSEAACNMLAGMLIHMAKQRAPRPNERVRKADADFADRYLWSQAVAARFPVTARLCSSEAGPAVYALARDLVYSLLER